MIVDRPIKPFFSSGEDTEHAQGDPQGHCQLASQQCWRRKGDRGRMPFQGSVCVCDTFVFPAAERE